jgi:glycosyltransferase involved in cell wall biosynthesis
MKISIITPNFNYGRFLPDLINSIQSQAVEYELIICDGKSTDSSHAVITEYMQYDKSIKWIKTIDLNQSDALNKCLSAVTGEWICWVNSDEFLNMGALVMYLGSIERYPDVDVFYGDAIFCTESTEFIRTVGKHSFSRNVLEGYGTYIQTNSLIIKTQKIKELSHPIFDTNLELIMDQDFFLKLSYHNLVFKYVPFAFGIFRVHGNQKTSTMENRILQEKKYLKNRYPKIALERRTSSIILHRLLKFSELSYLRELQAFIEFRKKDMRWWERTYL